MLETHNVSDAKEHSDKLVNERRTAVFKDYKKTLRAYERMHAKEIPEVNEGEERREESKT